MSNFTSSLAPFTDEKKGLKRSRFVRRRGTKRNEDIFRLRKSYKYEVCFPHYTKVYKGSRYLPGWNQCSHRVRLQTCLGGVGVLSPFAHFWASLNHLVDSMPFANQQTSLERYPSRNSRSRNPTIEVRWILSFPRV